MGIGHVLNTALRTVGFEVRRVGKPAPKKGEAGWVDPDRNYDAGANFPLNAAHLREVLYFQDLLGKVKAVRGDIVECGVGTGLSLFILTSLAGSRRLIGFDSFEGLPAPTDADTSGGYVGVRGGRFANAQDVVRQRIERHGGRLDAVSFVPGWFSATLPLHKGEIAFLHLDVDLRESYATCLKYLFPLIQPGGIVAFDEYRDPLWPGATVAIDEYFATRPERPQHSALRDRWYVVKAG